MSYYRGGSYAESFATSQRGRTDIRTRNNTKYNSQNVREFRVKTAPGQDGFESIPTFSRDQNRDILLSGGSESSKHDQKISNLKKMYNVSEPKVKK